MSDFLLYTLYLFYKLSILSIYYLISRGNKENQTHFQSKRIIIYYQENREITYQYFLCLVKSYLNFLFPGRFLFLLLFLN